MNTILLNRYLKGVKMENDNSSAERQAGGGHKNRRKSLYKPIEDDVAKKISDDYDKDVVIILTIDKEHELIGLTPYGNNEIKSKFAVRLKDLIWGVIKVFYMLDDEIETDNVWDPLEELFSD